MEPIFRWAGSKKALLPLLQEFWTPHFVRYLEAFAGSAALYFRLLPHTAQLNDLNGELVKTYQTIVDRPDEVADNLQKMPNTKAFYYHVRSQTNLDDNVARAARFIFLNRYCFNGLYRTNHKGEFNVPYAPRKTGQLPSKDRLREISATMNRVTFSCIDFEDFLLSNVRERDFVYLDPPYFRRGVKSFTQYGPKLFDFDDLERLMRVLEVIDKRGAAFVLSYADCEQIQNLKNKWNFSTISVPRRMASKAERRNPASEIVASNLNLGLSS